MSITPTVLIAGSGLLNNQALSIDTDYVSDTSQAALVSEFHLIPFLARVNATWNQLAQSSKDRTIELFGDYPFILQNALTNPNDADYRAYDILYKVKTAQTNFNGAFGSSDNRARRINYMFNQVGPLVYGAEETYAAISHYKNKSWDDISLDAKDHSDLATNGLLRVLLTGSDDQIDNIRLVRQQLREGETLNDVAGRRLALLSKALRNLGTLYDPDDLANMGKAKTLIENMYSLGLSRVGNLNQLILELEISSLDDIRDQYLAQVLTKITGKALADIIDRTGVVLVNPGAVKTLADLLIPENLFGAKTLAELPNGTLTGLAEVLDKINGRYQTLSDVADMLDTVEIPDLSALVDEVQPVPQTDIDLFLAKYGSGTGLHGNPTIGDFFWWLTGQSDFKNIIRKMRNLNDAAYDNVNLRQAIHYYFIFPTTPASFNNVIEQLAKANIVLYWARECGKVFDKLVTQYQATKQLYTLHFGTTMSSYSALTTVDENDTGLSATILNLHNYGVDSSDLGFKGFWEGLANTSRYGEAVKASLTEGRVLQQQAAQGRSTIGIAELTKVRRDSAKVELESAIASLKTAHNEYEAVMKNAGIDPKIKADIINNRKQAIERVKQLGPVAGEKVNPYREIY